MRRDVVNWKCPNCGAKARVRVWPVRCSCGLTDYGEDGAKLSYITHGPGTELKKIIAELFPGAIDCSSCTAYANLMNRWGPDECRRKIPEIVERLKSQLNRFSSIDIIKAALKSLKVTFPALLNPLNAFDEAIKIIVEDAIAKSEYKLISVTKFIRTFEMVEEVYKYIGEIPPDIDAVIGVARSGMLPASIIAMNNHIPLFSCDIKNKVIRETGYGYRSHSFNGEPKHVLIVEDTIMNGLSIREAISIVKKQMPSAKITDFVVYVNPRQSYLPVIYCSKLYPPHLLEWNFFNSVYVHQSAFDLDGVLCYDGPRPERGWDNIDERPLYIPRFAKIPAIVTGRPEFMRKATEEWLAKHNIQYDELIMWNGCMKEWMRDGAISEFKARAYEERKHLRIFVESCPIQAREIHRITGKMAISPVTGEVFGNYGDNS